VLRVDSHLQVSVSRHLAGSRGERAGHELEQSRFSNT
jgi:hypothetical protein